MDWVTARRDDRPAEPNKPRRRYYTLSADGTTKPTASRSAREELDVPVAADRGPRPDLAAGPRARGSRRR